MTQYKWMDGDRTFVVQVIQHKASFFKSRGSAGRFKEAMAPDVGNFLEHSATWSLANDVRVGNLAGREFRYGAKEANGERTGIIRAFLSGTTWYRITASMTSTPTDAKLDLIQGIVNSFVPVR